jgi:hypothetical protein
MARPIFSVPETNRFMTNAIRELQALRAQKTRALLQSLDAGIAAGRKGMLPAEQRLDDEIKALEERISDLSGEFKEQERTREARAAVGAFSERIARNSGVSESRNMKLKSPNSDYHLTYRQHDIRVGSGGASWVRDLMRASIPGMDDDGSSRRRLQQHAEEVSRDVAFAEFRDLSRIDGQGGYA